MNIAPGLRGPATAMPGFHAQEVPPLFRRDTPGNSFARLITAHAIASLQGKTAVQIATDLWPTDYVVRAATAPAMTSVTGWAAELAQRVLADAIEALGAVSAGARILEECLTLTWDGAGSIGVPGFVPVAANAGFVAEGAPIPVKQLSAAPAVINPHKLAAISVLSREMIEGSNAEKLVSDALIGAAGLALDAVLFDSNPEDAVRPAGLRNGINALTPSANTDSYFAFLEDIATLVGAISVVGGAGPYIIAMSAARGTTAALRTMTTEENASLIFVGTSSLTNDVVAIAPAAVAAALAPDPVIETSKAASLHMDDASPQPIGSVGPARSMFQIDSVALKMRWPISWVRRDARGVAWLTPIWK